MGFPLDYQLYMMFYYLCRSSFFFFFLCLLFNYYNENTFVYSFVHQYYNQNPNVKHNVNVNANQYSSPFQLQSKLSQFQVQKYNTHNYAYKTNTNTDSTTQKLENIISQSHRKNFKRVLLCQLYAAASASRATDFDETKGYSTYVVPKFLPIEELSSMEELKSCFGLSRQLKRPLSVSDKLKSIFLGLKSKYSNLNHEDEINSLYRFFGLPYLADGKFSTLVNRYEAMMEKYKKDRKMKILIDWNLDKIIDHIIYMRIVHGQQLLNAEDNVTYKFIKNRFIEMDKTKLERNKEKLGLLSSQEREKAIETKAKENYRRNSLLSYLNPIAYVQYYVFTLQKSFVGLNGANITYLAVLAPLYIMVYNYITTTLFARIFGSFLASWVLYSKGLPTDQGGRAPPISRSRLKEAISCVFFMGFVGVLFGKLYVAGSFPIPFEYTTREQWNTFMALIGMLLAPNLFTVRFRQ